MQIQVNTDNFIHGDERVIEVAKAAVLNDLGHMDERLTRIEVHLKDQNAEKHGPDHILCTIEARPRGMDPMSAHHGAADIQAALKGSAKKLRTRLSSVFEKASAHR
ncbi:MULTISPECIES: hypothetical protein [unclassified Shimia]|uniref:hypothetical protein n=1 Tax=unclassified Shimia TaxID=2630038 RepID=UPI0006B650C1|nr:MULTISPECIES: hypothetical protein [unclassified Shimia]KPA23161.1 hypothetical protein shim_14560 [Shimia sp. SK013]